MTTTDMASALEEVQAKLAAAHLVAEWFHGIDSRDLDRAMATWHPLGVSSFTSGPVLEGSSAIRAWLEKASVRYAEVYHWVTNLSLTVRGGSTMHGEGRITALCYALGHGHPRGGHHCPRLHQGRRGMADLPRGRDHPAPGARRVTRQNRPPA